MDVHTSFAKVRRLYLRYRRWLAAAAAAGCVLAVLHELAPPPPTTIAAVVAARDLKPGQRLAAGDLRLERLTPGTVPSGSARSVDALAGERLTGPLRQGEVVTDAHVLSPELVDQYGPGMVATPVRLPDAAVVALLEIGDSVDVYAATGAPGRPADQVVSDASVVAVPTSDNGRGEGAIVVLALSESQTARLAQASATTQLSISMR